MPYIDSHVHIWTDDYQTYPFAPDSDPADASPVTFHVEDILGHARPCGVDRVVLVQMSYYGTDNRYMLKAMADAPDVFGGIGIVDWDDPAVEEEMTRLAAERVYGFRVYPRDVPPATWCDGPGFDRMFAAAARQPAGHLSAHRPRMACRPWRGAASSSPTRRSSSTTLASSALGGQFGKRTCRPCAPWRGSRA